MIYKFICRYDGCTTLELSTLQETIYNDVDIEVGEETRLSVEIQQGVNKPSIVLTKEEVFKLIGALHCIQKDMK